MKSSGSAYIDTGEKYTWLDGMAVEVKFSGLTVKSYGRVFGDNVFNLMQYSNSGTICTEYGNNTSSGVIQGTKVSFSSSSEFVLKLENDIVTLNDSQVWDATSVSDYTSKTNFYLFSTSNTWDNNPTGKASPCEIYYFKIWKDGTLIHDYEPYTLDGTVGMYDTVTNTFFAPTKGTLSLVQHTEYILNI